MDPDVRTEIRLSLLLLGADELLLAALDDTDDRELVEELRNWNEAKLLELKEWLPTMTGADLDAMQERIRQYEALRAPQKAA